MAYKKLIEEQNINFEDNNDEPLSWEEAEQRSVICGKNIIDSKKKTQWYVILFHSFVNPFSAILFVLSIISGAHLEFETMAIMLVIVFLSSLIQFVQELKSNVKADALKKLVQIHVTVIRVRTNYCQPDGIAVRELSCVDIENGELLTPRVEEVQVPLEDIVPGDVVKLSAGDIIPGDLQLTQSKDLFVSQAALTGESLPVEKHILPIKTDVPACVDNLESLIEKPDICFMGTNVTSGIAKGVIRRIGASTVFGGVASRLAKKTQANEYQKGVTKLSYMFIALIAIIFPTVLILNGSVTGNWLHSFMFSLTVAVNLCPELLPMIVNANLCFGVIEMARKKCIIKRLEAVINLGSIDTLCTDKTGTLTENKVVVKKHVDLNGRDCLLPLQLAYLNSYFQTSLKNVIDDAILEYSAQSDHQMVDQRMLENFDRIEEIPFDFNRRRMSVILKRRYPADDNLAAVLVVKGAFEEMTENCKYIVGDPLSNNSIFPVEYYLDSPILPFSQQKFEAAKQVYDSFCKDGMRVIVVAYRIIPLQTDAAFNFDTSIEQDLVFAGFIASLDPPKESAYLAIKELNDRNVEVKVLTGDSPLVCQKVCNDIELPVKGIVCSEQLEGVSDEELFKIVDSATIFAKVTPMQKQKIVAVLKSQNRVVGFLGDGINDAPALKEADVGISVDTAVDVARETANVILLEKSLLVLADGVIRGRITFGNTSKYMKMVLSTNFGYIFSVIAVSTWLPFIPMTPIQAVLVNLLYDLSEIAIPWDSMDEEYLTKPHRFSPKDMLRFMAFVGPMSSIIDISTYCFMWFYYGNHQALFQTAWFVESLIIQTITIHLIRTPTGIPFIQSRANYRVTLSTIIICAIGISIPYVPVIGTKLGMVHLPALYYAYLGGAMLTYGLLVLLIKKLYIKLFHIWI